MGLKFTLERAFQFGWEGLKGWAYNSANDFPRASAAIFEVTTHHGKVKSTISDRVYYVLEGNGDFVVGEEVVHVKAQDVVIVPKNTPYDYRGKMRLFLVHVPAYDESGEVKME